MPGQDIKKIAKTKYFEIAWPTYSSNFFAEGVNLVLVHSEGVNTILLISRKTFLSTYLSFFLTVLLVLEIHWD